MSKFKRVLKVLGKGALILILALAAIHGIASMVLSRRVASRIAEIKAQGDPVSMADLGRVDIPDSENGATIYMQIFKEMGRSFEFANGISRMKIDKTKNFDYIELVGKSDSTPEMWAKARGSLATYQHAFDLVDEAASRPKCKFDTNGKGGLAALSPIYGNLRELSRMLTLDARVSARAGHVDKAVERVGQIFKVSQSITADWTLTSRFLQIAIVAFGLRSIRNIEKDTRVNAAQAEYLDNILAGLDLSHSYMLAMKGERALSIYSYNKLLKSGSGPRPFLLLNELASLDFIDRMIRDASLSCFENPMCKPGYDVRRNSPNLDERWNRLIPVFIESMQRRDAAISGIRSGRAFLGAIVYREKFGAYPQSLDDLRSRLGWKVEKDPLTGKDFHYERQGAGFLLYGVGPNLRDDGGVFRRKKLTDPPNPEYDDIVWEMAK